MMRQSYAFSAYAQAGLRLRPPSAYAPFSRFRDCRSPSRTALLLTIRASTFITMRIIANVFFVYKFLTYTKFCISLHIFLVSFVQKFGVFLLVFSFADYLSHQSRILTVTPLSSTPASAETRMYFFPSMMRASTR